MRGTVLGSVSTFAYFNALICPMPNSYKIFKFPVLSLLRLTRTEQMHKSVLIFVPILPCLCNCYICWRWGCLSICAKYLCKVLAPPRIVYIFHLCFLFNTIKNYRRQRLKLLYHQFQMLHVSLKIFQVFPVEK